MKATEDIKNHFDIHQTETETDSFGKTSKNDKPKIKAPKNKSKGSKSRRRNRERYEVVYRSLLRRFRKFYNHEFDSATRYKSLKRYRNNAYFIECVTQYVKKVFQQHYSQKLVFSLWNLIYPSILVKYAEELK